MHRALPDARDGLKPVHRRILHAMRLLRLDPGQAFKKCARIVGDVIGKYHPHGDQAVYDALVRLAQDFAQRYPLVDGQGNFGNIDGDNAAAYRYTEARLTEVARLLLDGIDEDAVDFRETYNGEDEEPVVLPAAFPNLLANGSQGIAVGMATSIPPHNAAELCDAALYLIQHPNATSEQLMTFVQGPDFPTGGVIVEPRASMQETYRTGRGSFRVRARWHKEETTRGGWVDRRHRDPLSRAEGAADREDGRAVQRAEAAPAGRYPRRIRRRTCASSWSRARRTLDPALLMEWLFKLTELESRIPMNMNVLTGGLVPRVLGLSEALREWLDHRRVVLQRRSRFRLGQIEKRLEILRGLLIVYLDLDKVIKIIREEDEPKAELMRFFELTDNQAEAILNTRLRSLRKLEEMELKRELDDLTSEKDADRGAARLRREAVEDDRLADPRGEEDLRPGDDDRQAPHELRRCARDRRLRHDRGHGRARAADRRRVAERLDPRAEGPCAGPLGPAVQGRRRAQDLVLHRRRPPRSSCSPPTARVYTLEASKLPGGRGFGDPIRLMADIDEGAEIVTVWPLPARDQAADRHDRRARLRRAVRGCRGQYAQGHARCSTSTQSTRPCSPFRPKATTSPSSARTASCSSSRSTRSRRWAAARASACSATRTAACPTPRSSSWSEGLTWLDTSGRTWTVSAADLKDWIGNRGRSRPPAAERLPEVEHVQRLIRRL